MKFLKFLYKKEITPIFMVKILDFNCEKFLTKSCFFLFTFVWIFTRNMFSINHYVSVEQYFYQWLHYDNKNLLRTLSTWIVKNYPEI